MTKDFYAQAGSVHWQTPPEIIDAAREALGGVIGLDPCGPSGFSDKVLKYPEYDGREESWTRWANVRTAFINPPFGTCYLGQDRAMSAEQWRVAGKPKALKTSLQSWANKVCEEAAAGMGCIWISKACMETWALQYLMSQRVAACFPAGRVCYLSPDGSGQATAPTFPSVLIALGPVDCVRFRRAFDKIGVCV